MLINFIKAFSFSVSWFSQSIIKLTCVIKYKTPTFCLRKRVIKNKPHINLIHSRKPVLILPEPPITRSCSCKHNAVATSVSHKNRLWFNFCARQTDAVGRIHSMQYMKSPARYPSALATWIFYIIFECKIILRGQEKGMTEDEMVGWQHRLNGHEFG